MITLTRSRSQLHAASLLGSRAKSQEADPRGINSRDDSSKLGPEHFPQKYKPIPPKEPSEPSLSLSELSYCDSSKDKKIVYISPEPEREGLGIFTSMLFIIGECVGCGVLALPHALSSTGWFGVLLILFCAMCVCFTGTCLGRCWYMILCNKPGLDRHCAAPYPQIGYECFGMPGRAIVTLSVNLFLYGVCTCILLLSGENIQNLLAEIEIEVSLCWMAFLTGLILIPFCWLKSPKDFWGIALLATSTTMLSNILVMVQCYIDIPIGHKAQEQYYAKVDEGLEEPVTLTPYRFFNAFGAVLFSYGGMAVFPTIQADMRDPKRFPLAVLTSMFAIVVLYVSVASMGYYTYGPTVKDNILSSISHGPCMTIANTLSIFNLFAAFVITQNPISQLFEWFLGIKDKFSVQRMIARSMVTCFILFTAMSVPKFGVIIAVVGGGTVTLNSFVFPSVFYMRLTSMKKDEWRHTETKQWEYPTLCMIMCIALIGGISTVYFAIQKLVDPNSFTLPCYIRAPVADTSGSVSHANRFIRSITNTSMEGAFP